MGGNADTGNGFLACWSISRFVALYLIKNKSDFDDTEDEDAMQGATRGSSSTGRPLLLRGVVVCSRNCRVEITLLVHECLGRFLV